MERFVKGIKDIRVKNLSEFNDVVSLLWDPYYRLEDDMRDRLLDYYMKHITNPPQSPFSKGGLRGITENEFRRPYFPANFSGTCRPSVHTVFYQL